MQPGLFVALSQTNKHTLQKEGEKKNVVFHKFKAFCQFWNTWAGVQCSGQVCLICLQPWLCPLVRKMGEQMGSMKQDMSKFPSFWFITVLIGMDWEHGRQSMIHPWNRDFWLRKFLLCGNQFSFMNFPSRGSFSWLLY